MSESSMECSVCGGDFDIDSEGGVDGHFGMLPVSFCPTCYACMCDMADQANHDEREWVGLTPADFDWLEQVFANKVSNNFVFADIVCVISAKLKEKNGWTS
jgi:hypothetical protein